MSFQVDSSFGLNSFEQLTMPGRRFLKIVCFLFLLTSCCRPSSLSYQQFYCHLAQENHLPEPMKVTPYFLVMLVNARHLDYTNNGSFLTTVVKHPDDGTKTGDVGHAWIYLKGKINDKDVVIEGGHSGETGRIQPRYFDGIMNYNDWGCADPSYEHKRHPCYEPNPVKYLWAVQQDGFFQKGAGGHIPTFAAKVDLTEEQFFQILNFIRPSVYPFQHYSLTGGQCSRFVKKVAGLAGLDLQDKISMKILPGLWFRRRWVRLWKDPCYETITFSSPDLLEKSLIQAVRERRADYALDWYLRKLDVSLQARSF